MRTRTVDVYAIIEQEELILTGNIYGYVRVSTREQNEDRQLIALHEAGVLDKNIHLDKQSGKDFTKDKSVDIVVLSFVAENERTNIRQRQAEGIAAAKAKGVRFGRPPKPLPENFHNVYQRWKAGKLTGTAAAKECGMPLATFRYRADAYEKSKLL